MSRLKVIAAGNSPCFVQDMKSEIRIGQLDCIKKYFRPSQIKIRWTPDSYMTELYLHTSIGEFQVVITSLEDLTDKSLDLSF